MIPKPDTEKQLETIVSIIAAGVSSVVMEYKDGQADTAVKLKLIDTALTASLMPSAGMSPAKQKMQDAAVSFLTTLFESK